MKNDKDIPSLDQPPFRFLSEAEKDEIMYDYPFTTAVDTVIFAIGLIVLMISLMSLFVLVTGCAK